MKVTEYAFNQIEGLIEFVCWGVSGVLVTTTDEPRTSRASAASITKRCPRKRRHGVGQWTRSSRLRSARFGAPLKTLGILRRRLSNAL